MEEFEKFVGCCSKQETEIQHLCKAFFGMRDKITKMEQNASASEERIATTLKGHIDTLADKFQKYAGYYSQYSLNNLQFQKSTMPMVKS